MIETLFGIRLMLRGYSASALYVVACAATLLLLVLPPAAFLTISSKAAASQEGDAARNRRREVAVTFDDLPLQGPSLETKTLREMTARLLQSTRANHVPVFGDVNERKLYSNGKLDAERVAILRLWLNAGAELGNHTFSHMSLKDHPLSLVEQDLIRGETITKQLLAARGMKLKYFRHPELQTGPDLETKKAFEKFLSERGYTVAPVTIDNQDFIFAILYARAKHQGDTELMKRIADEYIPYMERMFEFFEKLSVDVVGYEVKQVLLLHASELNADHFDDLARMMKRRGYTFISLEQALEDKAYLLADAPSSKGLSWLHRWALAKGMEMRQEPREPEWLATLFKSRE
jgi:peptidoglycan/xylan/chitin deacetylase (PgdA/CDA1 family)